MDWRKKYRPYIIAATLAFIMTMFVAPEMMEGDSMEPTLSDGQAYVVTKTHYSAKQESPARGKIICMEKLYSQEVMKTEDNVIGRVVGLPGDTIKIKNGNVTCIKENGKKEVIGAAPEEMEKTIKLEGNDVYIGVDNIETEKLTGDIMWGVVDMREIKGNVAWTVYPFSEFGKVK